MAKRTKRRKRHHHAGVSAPRKRRRKVGYAPVIGASHKRRRRKKMGAPKHGRRRIGASRAGNDVMEYVGLGIGTGVGLTVGEILSKPMNNAITPAGSAAVKLGTSILLFAANKAYMKDNSFAKGVSIGIFGSAANDGIRALRSAGIISGVPDTVIVIKDNNAGGGGGMRKLNPGSQQQLPAANQMSGHMPVIGSEDEWHQAHVINA